MLNDLAVRLTDAGRWEEALAAEEEVVLACRELVQINAAEYLSDLATALGDLSVRLSDLGRRQDGLAAIEESVAVQRRLVAADPAAFLPVLAGAWNNLSVRLTDLSQRADALAAAEEAVTLYRQLPTTFGVQPATTLNMLPVQLGMAGQSEAALAVSEEAVATCRTSIPSGLESSTATLGTCLNNLSNWYDALGRLEESLAASQEAAAVYRELRENSDERFADALAGSLANVALELQALNRPGDAVAAAREAVDIRIPVGSLDDERVRLREGYPSFTDAQIADLAVEWVAARTNARREEATVELLRGHSFEPEHFGGPDLRLLRECEHRVAVEGLTPSLADTFDSLEETELRRASEDADSNANPAKPVPSLHPGGGSGSAEAGVRVFDLDDDEGTAAFLAAASEPGSTADCGV